MRLIIAYTHTDYVKWIPYYNDSHSVYTDNSTQFYTILQHNVLHA